MPVHTGALCFHTKLGLLCFTLPNTCCFWQRALPSPLYGSIQGLFWVCLACLAIEIGCFGVCSKLLCMRNLPALVWKAQSRYFLCEKAHHCEWAWTKIRSTQVGFCLRLTLLPMVKCSQDWAPTVYRLWYRTNLSLSHLNTADCCFRTSRWSLKKFEVQGEVARGATIFLFGAWTENSGFHLFPIYFPVSFLRSLQFFQSCKSFCILTRERKCFSLFELCEVRKKVSWNNAGATVLSDGKSTEGATCRRLSPWRAPRRGCGTAQCQWSEPPW